MLSGFKTEAYRQPWQEYGHDAEKINNVEASVAYPRRKLRVIAVKK